MDDVTAVVAALNKSGFPLQTRVEHEIQARVASGWKLLASEHPWRDPDGQDQFVDLIASRGGVVLVIECKKAQESSLLFLRPLGGETTGIVKDVTVWHVEQKPGTLSNITLPEDIQLEPESYRSQFCVATATTGQQRLLEKDARLIVLAADHVATDFARALLPSRSLVVPVIVTTASLFTLRFQPTEIGLDTGRFSKLDHKKIESIRWVRFHKRLAARPSNRPRTVFVVNSEALPIFLETSRGHGFTP